MAINQTRSPKLFVQKFEDVPDDANRIIHASLKSANDLDGGILTGGSTATYNNAGMYNGADGWIKWSPTTAQQALLEENAHLHIEIEGNLFASSNASAERICTLNIGNNTVYKPVGNTLYTNLDGVSTPIAGLNKDARFESHMKFDFILTSGGYYTFVDGLFCRYKARTRVSGAWSSVNVFASQVGTSIWTKPERFRNIYLVAGETPGFYKHPQLSNIVYYGDSLSQQGNITTGLPDFNGVNGLWNDAGVTGRMHKNLASAGLKAIIQNKAIAGYDLALTQTLVDAETNLHGKIVLIIIGTNDTKFGSLSPTFDTRYQTLIDDITALGADHIFITTITSTAEDETVNAPDAVSAPAVDPANVIINTMGSTNANVSVIDLFTLFGGHNFIVDMFGPKNLHWSAKGSNAAGEKIIGDIMEHYLA